jgi:sugar phosphate isomerase/epimerase
LSNTLHHPYIEEDIMRFGIMAMQLNSLVPTNLTTEEALMHLATYDLAKTVRELHQAGFNPIELGYDLGILLPHIYSPEAIEGLLALKLETGVSYTIHLPLWSVEPSTPLNPVRQGSVQALIEAIQHTLPLEPEIYVLHATGAMAAEFYHMKIPELARNFLLQQFQYGARESLNTILTETSIPSRQIAIETIQFPLPMTLELAEELDLSICFDTGHVLVGFSGPVEILEALELCLPRLGEVHLHDGPAYKRTGEIGYGKDHKALGTGDLDVERFLGRLGEAGFDGPIVFELQLHQALASTTFIHSHYPHFTG